MKMVIDTSVVIDYLRTKRLDSAYVEIRKIHDLVFSLITIAELYSGKSVQEEGPERKTLDDIVHGAEIEIPDLHIAKMVGLVRAKYNLSIADAFVASLALELKIPLATLNIRDFKKIEGLQLYNL